MTHVCKRDIVELAAIDEVVSIARRVQKARDAEDEARAKKVRADVAGKHSEKRYFEGEVLHHGDIADITRATLSTVKASTLAGASVQIADALCQVEQIGNIVEDSDGPTIQQSIKAIERLLYSVLDVIEARAGLTVSEIAPFIACPYLNPWRPVEERHPSIVGTAAKDGSPVEARD